MNERKEKLIALVQDYAWSIYTVEVEAEYGSVEDWKEATEERDKLFQEITKMVEEGV